MNEFRKFMGQKPFESFEEWNSDKDVHVSSVVLYYFLWSFPLMANLLL